MTPAQRDALTLILGYIDAYECTMCGAEEAGQHEPDCPVLIMRPLIQEKPRYMADLIHEIHALLNEAEREVGQVILDKEK